MKQKIIWAITIMVIFCMAFITIGYLGSNPITIRFEMDDNMKEAIKSINYSAIESKPSYINKCFERTIRWDRILDAKENNFISGEFYNTSWIETDCRKFNRDMIYNPDQIKLNNSLEFSFSYGGGN